MNKEEIEQIQKLTFKIFITDLSKLKERNEE